MENKCLFRVGDRVWSVAYGWGNVKEIGENVGYPVDVEYINRTLGRIIISYSNEGKQNVSENRTLFFEEIAIPKSALERPRKTAIELLEECEEVEFIAGKDNFYIFLDYDERGKSRVGWAESSFTDRLGIKYIAKEDAQRIKMECRENNREE